MSRCTMDRWARAFELHKFPEIGNMKPSEMMRQRPLAAAVPLAHPAPKAVLSLTTDASDTHVGGVLQQLNGGIWQPLAFYSKKLSGAGIRYSTFDRELLAAFSAVRHFRFLRGGRQFRLLTDHKPLVTSLFRTMPPWLARQQQQLSFIAELTSDIRHTPGQESVVADALSRPPPTAPQPSPALTAEDWPKEGLAAPDWPILAAIADAQPVDFLAMAAAQRDCLEVVEMMNSTTLQITTQAIGDEALLGDVSTGVFRSLMPIQHREAVFKALHAIHHPGVRATRRIIPTRFCWPQMAKAITQMARACLHCQWGKVHRHVHLQPAEIPVPHRRFGHIHVDLVGPLPPSRGHTYLFSIIDRTSRWPEAIPLASITAANCAKALFAGWVSRFGVPATITSDRGAQFTSALWAGLCSLLNIQHSPTTAYHPQSNGLVERFYRRLKDALQSRAANWHDHLPWVLLGIRTVFWEDSKFSPAEAVYGSQLVLPGQFINTAKSPSLSFLRELQTMMTSRQPPPARHNAAPAPSTLPEELLLARFVLVRRDGALPPLLPIYDDPYRVLERSTHFFLLKMGDRTNKVSTLRLKAARTPADTEPAKPSRRGRPVAQAPPVCAPPPKQRGQPCQVTFSLPPTTPPTTTSTSSSSGRPLHTTRPPNRLNL
jgi:hypothetical protein